MKKLNLKKLLLVELTMFSTSLSQPVDYESLTDEQIDDIATGIEKFVEEKEYWANFAHVCSVPKGHRTFLSRRLIEPNVKLSDVKPMAELVAPRPTKIALMTLEKTVQNLGDNAEYTREDIMFHKDDTVLMIKDVLKSKAVQKKDLFIGKAFVSSRAIVEYKASLLETLEFTSIVFKKNKANPWANGYYLCHITPELWKALKAEVRARSESLDEKTKVNINGKESEFNVYGDWMFSITTSEVLYKDLSTQTLVFQGRRAIDNQSGVDISKMEGYGEIEFGDHGLGKGIIEDEDGNLTNDKNKQKGSCYVNLLGIGAAVNDDLVVINCNVPMETISGSTLNLAELTGFRSTSPASTLTVSTVGVDGKEITGSTIVFKQKSSTGENVGATEGSTYPVVAGDTYYVSASKSGYTTVSVKVKAQPGDNTLALVLVTSA